MSVETLDPVATPVSNKIDSTSELDAILAEKLECAFHKETSTVALRDIARIAAEHSPIDLAYAASRLPPPARAVLYENLLHVQDKIKFMINTSSSTRTAVFREISDEEVKNLIENMPPDEAVEVLEDISERRFRRLMELLDRAKALRIQEIKKHERNTAGRLMTNEFFSFQPEMTVGKVAMTIRDNPGIDGIRRIFVLNRAGEIQGYVPSRNLIFNPPHLPLSQVMRPVQHKVTAETSREEVVDLVERYKISMLPVVDAEDRLVGVISYEDVIDALQDITDQTIATMAGTAEKVSEDEPLPKRFFSRAPWLIVTLCAGLINVTVMSSFQNYEKGILTFVLFFVPLITGMSGNIGIQCSTILVRNMASLSVSSGSRLQMVVKELVIGLFIALVFGILCGLLVFGLEGVGIWDISTSPAIVGFIVGMGLFGAGLTGTLLGVFSPLFFARIGIDPAVASGPIITAANDFLSMLIYFLIAMGLGALFF